MSPFSLGHKNVRSPRIARRKAIRGVGERARLRLETLEPRTLLAIVPLVDSTSVVRVIAQTQEGFEDAGFDWTGIAEPFDDSSWQSGARGVGYDLNVGAPYAPYIGVNVEATMLDNSATAFVRAPFSVVDPSALNGLTLRLRYDDGFIAWINGVEVLRRNALGTYPAWSSGAAAAHTATSTFSTFDMSPFLALLQPGPNMLAVRGLNVSASDNDFLIQAELEGRDDRPPTAANDVAIGIDGVAVPIDVLGNDEPGTSPLDAGSVRITSPPQSGTASVNTDGTVSYTPRVGFNGTDSFSYSVRDTSDVVGPGTTTRTLVSANAPAKVLIPTDDELGRSWTGRSEPFNDLGWRSGTLGVGYDTRTAIDDFRPYYDLSILDARFVNTSVYVRVPFSIDHPAEVEKLALRMRYDDGFVAYLNGVEIARANAPTSPTYNSGATDSTLDSDAVFFQEFDVSTFASALEVGGNVLAIHGLNQSLDSTDLLIQPELIATVTTRGRVSNVATVQLNVFPPNPVANDDVAATLEQTPLTIDVLANDEVGPLGFPLDPTLVEVVAAPTNGTATVDPATGAITYTPGDEFTGQDLFTYRAFDTAPGDGIFGPLTVIPFSAAWKYLPLGPDQGPASVWAAPGFDDSAWPSGPAELGYGDFDEATLIPQDPFGTPTVYFRRTFEIADPSAIYELGITLYRDDGAVVYLNGVEVARSNMPAGPITFHTLAPQFTPDDGEMAFGYAVPRSMLEPLLRPGTNTIAVEVHQYADISSDLSFQLGLTAEVYIPPGRPSQTATVAVTVAPNPNKPAAVADSYTLGEDEMLLASAGAIPAGVLDNDSDPNLDTLTAVLVAAPAHGAVAIEPDGSFTYTPTADFFGVDSFTYRAFDGAALSLPATVTLTIEPRNDAPRTAPDEYVVLEGETLSTAPTVPAYEAVVLASAPLGYWRLGESTSSPTAIDIASGFDGTFIGGVVRGAAGAIVGDANTAVEFDGTGRINMGFRSALNLPNNFSIEAWINPDTVSGYRHFVNTWNGPQGYGFGVHDGRMALATYGILDYETSAAVVTPGRWSHLVVVFDQGNDATFYLDGTLIQTIAGSSPARSSSQSFAIGATNVIGDPINRAFDGRIDEVAFYNRSLTATEVHAHYLAGIGLTGEAATAILIPLNATWKYRDNIANGVPYPVDAQGDDWVERQYDDMSWPSGAGVLGYGVINVAPISTTIGFGGNTNDRYRTALFRRTFEVADASRVTAIAFNMLIDDGAAFYINGREVLRRNLPGAVGDNTLSTNTLAPAAGDEDNYRTVVVNMASFPDLLVEGVNTIAIEVHQTAPNSSDLGFDLSLVATVLPPPLRAGLLANDVDPEGDALIASLISTPQNGSVSLQSDGNFIYTPLSGFVGFDTFEYTASDDTQESNPTTVTIVVKHVPPAAVPEEYSTDEDTALIVSAAQGVLANDTDTQAHSLTAILVAPPEHGTLTLGADGAFEYVPIANYHGPDRFRYLASDGEQESTIATVDIAIRSVNDAPIANSDRYTMFPGESLVADVPILFSTTPAGSSTLISTSGGEFFYDKRLHRFYAESSGQIRRYDVASGTELVPFIVPSSITGCDISVDHRSLYCADGQTGPSTAYVQKIRLSDGLLSSFEFDRGGDGGGEDLVIGAGGVALFHHSYPGSGTTWLRRLDTNTDTFLSNQGELWEGASFYNGPGKETFVVIERALSIGTMFALDGRTFSGLGAFSIGTNNGGVEASINRNGTLVALSCCGGVAIRSRTMQSIRTLSGLTLPFAFDPNRDRFYATDTATDELVAIDTGTWQQLFRVPIAENVTGGGDMVVSNNGEFVFMRTPSGIRMINVSQPDSQLGVLSNDSDADRDVLSASLVKGPDHGALELRSDGTFSYAPAGGFVGTDEFSYRVSDGTTMSQVATVRINVLSDLTGDGVFDRSDTGVLARNFGRTTGATRAQGDFDGDGAVTLADVGILQTIMGLSLEGSSGSPVANSPINPPSPSAAEALVAVASSRLRPRLVERADHDLPAPTLRMARRSGIQPHLSEAIVDALFAESMIEPGGQIRKRRPSIGRTLVRGANS